MAKTNDYAIWAFLIILVFLVFGLFSDLGIFRKVDLKTITGRSTTADAETLADIQSYFAINMSVNMSTSGIVFDIDELPVTSSNATANYDNSTGGNNETKLYLTVEIDSNVNVDFCIRANDSLRYQTDYIGLGNYTWANYTLTNISWPAFSSAKALVEDPLWDNTSANIVSAGNSTYYRFWLSVPGTQSPGIYKNQINFKGVQQGNSC